MKVWSESFAHNAAMDEQFAFGKPDAQSHVALSQNRNPHLVWSDAPAGTRSFVVICTDSDVPSRGDDVLAAIKSHVLASASITGTYTLNPKVA